jgi:hypothetical protein
MLAPVATKRRFQLVLIKNSHYDDDGYVIQWWRSSIPANSLACVYTLAADAAARQVLGPDVEMDITAMDETNRRVKIKDIIALIRRHGGFGMVGLVGVQSNQFPRALDVARPLRAAGIQVVIGGFHVSGCIAMLPERPPDLNEALAMGCSLYAGEAENGRMDEVLQDAAAGTLKPIYHHLNDLPSIEAAPTPFLPRRVLRGTLSHHASFDAGRGCPFQCSFCTIINVQGRKSRRRSPDDVERLIRQHAAEGVHRFFITDDNLARNKDWEAIFDRLIELRERDKIPISLIIQVDTLCHKIPNFVEKAWRAGVRRVFIGLENINPANLMAAKKRQNKITEYRKMLLAWKNAGVVTYAGYILGFPADTLASIREDIAIIKRELPVDILQFYFLTPLPGSEDHKVLWQKGEWMDPDLNKYDLEHAVAHHPKMSREEWEAAYREAWASFYTPEHMTTIMRRGAAAGVSPARLMGILALFSFFLRVEKVHPVQGGLIRLKSRRDRRPGLPIEPAWSFYPRYVWETVSKQSKAIATLLRLAKVRYEIRRDPQHRLYTDLAMTPVCDDETGTLEMFTHNDSARTEVVRLRKIDALTHAEHAPKPQPAA